MSTSVASVVAHFPDAENGFTTTTAGAVAPGATVVQLNSVAGYANGQPAVFVIDPTDVTKKQTFTGIVDTTGVQVTGVVWTAGTNVNHALGATVVDYATATHIAMMSKGMLVSHTQDGKMRQSAVLEALGISGQTPPDYTLIGNTLTSATYNGNHSYTLVFNAVDLTPTVNPGTRLRTVRTVAAPTQSTSLNGTSQYWVKTTPNKLTFTDDFTVSAWVKMTSYSTGADRSIVSRISGGANGWRLSVNAAGQALLIGFNAGSGNYSFVQSIQSIPLNKWVHITAQLDMSSFTATPTTSYVMLDGIDVPASVIRSGTNPTALVQAGNLEVGSDGAANFFPGKIAQVAVYSAKVTQATIQGYISQGLAGTEPNLASAYSFNGVTTDLNTTTPNDLSAGAGSPTATNADSPFGGQSSGLISSTIDYGIVQSAVFSTNTTIILQVPEGNTIPTTGGVSAVSYSSAKAPYGFPAYSDKWRISSLLKTTVSTVSNSTYGAFNNGGYRLTVPVGNWKIGHKAGTWFNGSSTSVWFNISPTPLTGFTNTQSSNTSPFAVRISSPTAATTICSYYMEYSQPVPSVQNWVMYTLGATIAAGIGAEDGPAEIFAENSYL